MTEAEVEETIRLAKIGACDRVDSAHFHALERLAAYITALTSPRTATSAPDVTDKPEWLFKFASRAYVLLSNLADDDECVSDDHGVCHTHGRGERVCSVAAATALLDEYTEQLDDLAETIDG